MSSFFCVMVTSSQHYNYTRNYITAKTEKQVETSSPKAYNHDIGGKVKIVAAPSRSQAKCCYLHYCTSKQVLGWSIFVVLCLVASLVTMVLYISLSIHLSINLSIYLSINQSISFSFFLSIYIFV